MSREKRYVKGDDSYFYKILIILILVLAVYSAVTFGKIMGNLVFEYNSDIIAGIDVEPLRKLINKEIPIIDTVYNSGKISVSLTSEINYMIKRIFNFDINNPLTILNAQTPVLYSYYEGEYKKEGQRLAEDGDVQNTSPSPTPNGQTVQPTPSSQPNAEQDKKDDYFVERTSSISIEDESEKREYTENEIIARGEIKVINETKYRVNNELIEKLYNEKLNIDFNKNGPKVLILHTHTNESYLSSLDEYNKKLPNRNDDPRFNVVRVGEEIARHLRKMGIEVLHNGTRHNFPTDDGCYVRSMETVSTILKSYPSIKLVLDIHRDGLDIKDSQLRVVSDVDGNKAAQVMFVVGTGEVGLSHPTWNENFKLAIHMQNFLNTKYPGLTRPIYLSKYRYNHHMSTGAMIVEVGADGNTLDEALKTTQYIAESIRYIINNTVAK